MVEIWKRSGRYHLETKMEFEKMSKLLKVREQGMPSQKEWTAWAEPQDQWAQAVSVEWQDMEFDYSVGAWMGTSEK